MKKLEFMTEQKTPAAKIPCSFSFCSTTRKSLSTFPTALANP